MEIDFSFGYLPAIGLAGPFANILRGQSFPEQISLKLQQVALGDIYKGNSTIF